MAAVFDGGEFRLRLRPLSSAKVSTLELKVTALACTEKICLKPHVFSLVLQVFPFTSVLEDPSGQTPSLEEFLLKSQSLSQFGVAGTVD